MGEGGIDEAGAFPPHWLSVTRFLVSLRTLFFPPQVSIALEGLERLRRFERYEGLKGVKGTNGNGDGMNDLTVKKDVL